MGKPDKKADVKPKGAAQVRRVREEQRKVTERKVKDARPVDPDKPTDKTPGVK